MSRETDAAILAATRELLIEQGVHGLTMEGVAARAGVAKTTVYRRYRSKHELALAVLFDMVQRVVAVEETGDTRAELIALVDGAVHVLESTLMGRVMQGLVSDFASDPALGKAFREQVVTVRLDEVGRIVDRGIERGDLRPGLDHELVHELLFGPVYYRLLLSGGALDAGLAERVVDAVLPGLAASG